MLLFDRRLTNIYKTFVHALHFSSSTTEQQHS